MSYQTVWNHYQAGLIPNAKKIPSGIIIVDDEVSGTPERTAVYTRVSSSENKTNLISPSKRVQDFCTAKGWIVSVVVEECGSGLNDDRKKLQKLLLDKSVTRIVVEHKDRLTR
ncbi:resolvase-like protein [Thioploca ingrica]|uniref:Resolvase-like protein n=1 Tax=Thioploca ingrica TaxID=40754 RepID=A0A090BU44_9GAMM|nr:resolvase-like protein [Thioploca ingrica]